MSATASSRKALVYQEGSYRKAIEKIVSARKHLDSRMRFSRLAEHMRIQKSYLSKVLKGDAHLNSDQLHLGCEYLELDAHESKYLQLLLEWERSTIPSRKQELSAQINKFRERQMESKAHLQAKALAVSKDAGEAGAGGIGTNEYYIDPIYQLVHVALTIPAYRQDPKALASALGLPYERVEHAIQVLTRLGIIAIRTPFSQERRTRGEIEVLVKQVHLNRESPLYRPWRSQLRLWALQKLFEMGNKKPYTFSVVFSADEETRAEIQAKFLEFLSWAEKRVGKTKPERLFQMNFDLLPWT